MKKYSEAFVGVDTAKKKHAVAIADAGRDGEIRYLGEIDSSPETVARVIRKLADRYETLHVCYEAGPTGYGLFRDIRALGHDCIVVAPSLIPKKPGERVKTNRRDAVTLARLLRAGELTHDRPAWGNPPGANGGARGNRPNRGPRRNPRLRLAYRGDLQCRRSAKQNSISSAALPASEIGEQFYAVSLPARGNADHPPARRPFSVLP